MHHYQKSRPKRLSRLQLATLYNCLKFNVDRRGRPLSEWKRREYQNTIDAQRADAGKVVFVSKEYEVHVDRGEGHNFGRVPGQAYLKRDNGPAFRNPLYGSNYETSDQQYLHRQELRHVPQIVAEAKAAKERLTAAKRAA